MINAPANPLMIALIDYRLADIGLRPWPLGVEDYARLSENQTHLMQVYYFVQNSIYYPDDWEAVLGDWRPYYALLEFLTTVYETPLQEIESDIDKDRLINITYWSTLHNWSDQRFASNEPLELAWREFLAEKAAGGISSARIVPDQDLRLVCSGGDITTGIAFPTGVLYELDLETNQFTAVSTLDHGIAYLLSVSGDEGVIVAEQRLDYVNTDSRLLFWGDEDPVVLIESADNFLPIKFLEFEGREDEFLVFNEQDNVYGLFSLSQCQTAVFCTLSLLRRPPVWSPSGERSMRLILRDNLGYEGQFFEPFRLDWQQGSVIGPGKSQFWLDDERLGYVAEDGRTVMVMTSERVGVAGTAEVLFTIEEVDPLLALDPATTIESVAANPKEPEDLIVTVRDRVGWASIYQVNILRRWIQKLVDKEISLEPEVVYSYDFSPEARWLVISGNDLATSTAYLHFYDMDENEARSYAYKMVFERPMHWAFDWSAGDEWLAVPDNGYIRLIAPGENYQTVVSTRRRDLFGRCLG